MKGLERLCVQYKCAVMEKQFVSKISLRNFALFVDVASLGVKNGSVVGEEVVYCSRRCRREGKVL